jgi:hypothetical protein
MVFTDQIKAIAAIVHALAEWNAGEVSYDWLKIAAKSKQKSQEACQTRDILVGSS